MTKTSSSITVAVLDYFHIHCLSPKNIKKLEVGNTVSVKVSSVVMIDGRPDMVGDIDKVRFNLAFAYHYLYPSLCSTHSILVYKI